MNSLKQSLAKANMQVLYMDCLKFYTDSMQNSLRNDESFLSQSELQQTHENAKRETLSKVWTLTFQSNS